MASSSAANTSPENALTTTESYLCGVDPLFHDHVHILLGMVRQMEPFTQKYPTNPPFYFFRFPPLRQLRPIHLVTAGGIVVYSKLSNKYHGFILDDGSDTIPCVLWYSNSSTSGQTDKDDNLLQLGQFVQVDGQLQWKDGKVIINTSHVKVHDDPHAELLWWMKISHIHSRVYNQAFPIVGRIKIK